MTSAMYTPTIPTGMPVGYVPTGYQPPPPLVSRVVSAARQGISSAYFPCILQCLLVAGAPLMYMIFVGKGLSCGQTAAARTTAILIGVVFVLQVLCSVVPFTPLPIVVACTALTVTAAVFGAR